MSPTRTFSRAGFGVRTPVRLGNTILRPFDSKPLCLPANLSSPAEARTSNLSQGMDNLTASLIDP